MDDSQRKTSTDRLERLLKDYAAFLGGSIDMEAHFAEWRYTEVVSFEEPFALEIIRKEARIEIQKRVYAAESEEFSDRIEARYDVPHTVLTSTLSEETWNRICREAATLPIRIPNDIGINGRDGTMHSLSIGNHNQRITLTWWSAYSDELQPVVEYARKWRDTLLALDWQRYFQ